MPKLPLGMSERSLSEWLRGLASAFIAGGSGAVSATAVISMDNPKEYNLQNWHLLHIFIGTFFVSGFIKMFAFLSTKPLPDLVEVQSSVITAGKDPVTGDPVLTKVTQISVVPKEETPKP